MTTYNLVTSFLYDAVKIVIITVRSNTKRLLFSSHSIKIGAGYPAPSNQTIQNVISKRQIIVCRHRRLGLFS